jgi:DNA repair protein RecO (recombination protein O)
MVLSSTPIGEYDRRVVILTKEHGKVAAFAKGARRPTSPLVGAVNPFTFGTFHLYEGRTSYTIQTVQVQNYFAALRQDVVAAYYGFYFLEFADYYAKEGNDERELLKLLYQTLRALEHPNIPNSLIQYIFELRGYCIVGEGPQVFQCVSCGSSDRPSVFSVRRGGLVCCECAAQITDGYRLRESTLYTMQYIESAPIEKLYTFVVKDEVLSQLEEVLNRYRACYVEHRFKSLEILDTLRM